MYALVDIPGKGKGLIATSPIPRGTLILSETPLFTIPNPNFDPSLELNTPTYTQTSFETLIRAKVHLLTSTQQEIFHALHNAHPQTMFDLPYSAIFQSNALPCAEDNSLNGIFEFACRINHACNENAHMDWNSLTSRFTVHARRDIEEGEEITIYYIGSLTPREDRREKLSNAFDFECTCRLCSLPVQENCTIDEKLTKIQELHDILNGEDFDAKFFVHPLTTLRRVDELIHLYHEVNPGCSRAAGMLDLASLLAIRNSDLARGRIFAQRSIGLWTVLLGGDSPHVLKLKKGMQEPMNDPWYKNTTKWKTDVGDVPKDTKCMDVWLWKREESSHSS